MKPFQLRNKDGSLRYNGQWLIKFTTPDGKTKRVIGGATRKEAEAKLRGVLTDIERGIWTDPKEPKEKKIEVSKKATTWGDIITAYQKVKFTDPDQKCSRSTLLYALRFLENGIGESGPLLPASLPISRITRSKIRQVYDAFISASSFSLETRKLYFCIFKTIIKWAIDHDSFNLPIDLFRGIRGLSKGTKKNTARKIMPFEIFSYDEVSRLIDYAYKNDCTLNATMIETAFKTGLRKGELCGLLWSNIHFETGFIDVIWNYDRSPKNGEPRIVPLEPSLIPSLKKWKAESPCSKENDFVFPTAKGEMKKEIFNWDRLIRNTADKAGLLRQGLRRFGHMTRHCYCSHAIIRGAKIFELSKIMGHSDISLIYNTYGHFLSEDLKNAMSTTNLSYELDTDKKADSITAIHSR